MVRFIALPPGTYNVKVELSGFATVNQEGVALRVGQTAKLTVTLKVGEGGRDGQRHGRGAARGRLQDRLVDQHRPRADRGAAGRRPRLPALAFLAPGVQRERGGYRFISNRPVIGAGGNASQSTIMVDGVDFTDPTLGLARARFSQDAISEFRVIANRFDSEIGGSAGGALSIVTKSGTNDLAGSAFGFFRGKALRAKGDLELRRTTTRASRPASRSAARS